MEWVWRHVPPTILLSAALATAVIPPAVAAAARPTPPVKIEVYPEYRSSYEGIFLVLRDARACRLPEGTRTTGDESRGVRLTVDGVRRYETGVRQLGGSARWVRVRYGDPDDLIVRFDGGKSEGDYAVTIECRDEQRRWTKVGETSFPAWVPMKSSITPRVPFEEPVLFSDQLNPPCPSPCEDGEEYQHELSVNRQRLAEAGRQELGPGQAFYRFPLPPGLGPGIQYLEIRFRAPDGTPQGKITAPFISRFDENGAAKDVRKDEDGGGSRWMRSAPWIAGGAVLLLIAVRRVRRRA